MKVYSYVVEHDEGRAPNPYFRVCTLCRCKERKDPRFAKKREERSPQGDTERPRDIFEARQRARHGPDPGVSPLSGQGASDVGQVVNLRPIGNRPADFRENLSGRHPHLFS